MAALRLVNRLFHAAATPRLFRSFCFTHTGDYERLMAARALGFIRSITIKNPLGVGPDSSVLMAALLKQLPLLEEFMFVSHP